MSEHEISGGLSQRELWTSRLDHDRREFRIICLSADGQQSEIVVLATGKPKLPPPIGHFIEDLVRMLWLDAYEGGPWIPSLIESVTVRQEGGNEMTYSRAFRL